VISQTMRRLQATLRMQDEEKRSGTIRAIEGQLRRRIHVALGLSAVLLFGVGGWSAAASLSGAIIAPGTLVVDGHNKKVQHPIGGIVSEILVQNGQRVGIGDLLIRLDATQAKATLSIVEAELTQLRGRRLRLSAERDGVASLAFPSSLLVGDEQKRVAAAELRLFEARRSTRDGQKAALTERIGQLEQEFGGFVAQQRARMEERDLLLEEIGRTEHLEQRKLVPVTRLVALKREAARLNGEIGQLTAQQARTKGQVSEITIQIAGIDQVAQADIERELRETDDKMTELEQRRLVADEQLKRIEVRSPQSGTVHELTVFTINGVVAAGEPLMIIVPDKDNLTVEARVGAADIDQLQMDQLVMLRFSAFNARTTPEVKGTVVAIGADLSRDPQSGASYYLVRIRIDNESSTQVAKLQLVPGMPVECFFVTRDRSPLSYLTKPLRDQISRTFREE